MKNLITLILLLLINYLSCTNNVAGGSDESQTGQIVSGLYGHLVDGNNIPAEGALVRLYSVLKKHRYNAYDSYADDMRDSSKIDSTVTDSAGMYLFDSISSGTYTIEGMSVILSDTLSALHRNIEHDSLTYVGIDTLKLPGYIRGAVDFDQQNKMSVAVYIPGTSYLSYTNNDGLFIISNVPPDSNYSVAYTYPGYITAVDSNIDVYSGDTTALQVKLLSRDPNFPPIPPVGMHAILDTVNGIVTISWNRVTDVNLAGYIVFRKDSSLTAIGPEIISGTQVVTDTIYHDTLTTENIVNGRVFQYQVKSINKKNDQSVFSWPVFVTIYSAVLPSKPSPSIGDTVSTRPVLLSWAGTGNDGDVLYTVCFDTISNPVNILAQNISERNALTGSLLESTIYYWYVKALKNNQTVNGPVWHFVTVPVGTVPSNPNPEVGDTVAAQSTVLSWVGTGDVGEVLYTVYFDTIPTPENIIAKNISVTNAMSGDLQKAKKYYWFVEALKNTQTQTGPVWYFTTIGDTPDTINHKPNIPQVFIPPNAAIQQDTTIILRWFGGDIDVGDIVTYTVYLGTSQDVQPLYKENLTAESCSLSQLESDKDYYWYIQATDGIETVKSTIWKFTTAASIIVPFKMLFVKGGTFVDRNKNAAGVPDFYMMETEVTLSLYKIYNPIHVNPKGQNDDKDPAIGISWGKSIEFANWLSKREGLDTCFILAWYSDTIRPGWEDDSSYWICDFNKNGYRLPTCDEWEYTGEGGEGFEHATNDGTSQDGVNANVDNGNTGGTPCHVKLYEPNPYGFYGMCGNAYEHVWGWYTTLEAGRYDYHPPANKANKYAYLMGGCFWDGDSRTWRQAVYDLYPGYKFSPGIRLMRSIIKK